MRRRGGKGRGGKGLGDKTLGKNGQNTWLPQSFFLRGGGDEGRPGDKRILCINIPQAFLDLPWKRGGEGLGTSSFPLIGTPASPSSSMAREEENGCVWL